MNTNRHGKRKGFTLLELLVVVLIVVLVSAATLPVVLPALNHRQVSEGARILQAVLAGARDAAIRSNAPRGIRLLPDPSFSSSGGALAANRMIQIEAAPDYSSGQVNIPLPVASIVKDPVSGNLFSVSPLIIQEAVLDVTGTFPNEPTSWYWNIRQGDKIRFDDSGRYYTIAGPMVDGPLNGNPERYINRGKAFVSDPNPLSATHIPEFLIVTNGQDDNGNGWVDESFDGIDNDNDGIIDPAFNGGNAVQNNGGEFEQEAFVGAQFSAALANQKYTIFRRPVVSESAREVALPQGVVIDMTTWNASSAVSFANHSVTIGGIPERSRLPVDPFTLYVDIMVGPNGQVIPAGPGQGSLNGGGTSPVSSLPFYHFWIAEREDVVEPIWGAVGINNNVPVANPLATSTQQYMLPMPQTTGGYSPRTNDPSRGTDPYLKGERRLVTMFTRTGLVLTNEIENFNAFDVNTPYYTAQFGLREAK